MLSFLTGSDWQAVQCCAALLYWQCILLMKHYIDYYKESVYKKCLFICFINKAMSFICQPNKMAHIAVALSDAILGRSLHICAYIYMYMYCTVTCSLHHPYGSLKSASKDWTVLGFKLFHRLELLRNLTLGTGVSQTPHSSSVIATMPWHYSHHCIYICVSCLWSALVPVPQSKIKGWDFTHC